MKRKIGAFLLLWAIIATLSSAAALSDAVSAAEDMYSVLGPDGEEVAREAENGTGFDLNRGLGKAVEVIFQNFGSIFGASLRSSAKLILTTLVFSLGGMFISDGGNISKGLNVAATGVISVFGISEVSSGLQTAVAHQNRLSDFIKLLLPMLTAAGAAGGSGGESLMLQSGIALFCQLTVSAYSKLMIPFLFCYIAVRLGGVLADNTIAAKAADWVKGLVTGAMKIWLMLFFAYLSICGVAGKAADSLALRSAKTAASSVPYIGGVAAEAADAVAAGAGVLKGYLGVFGTVGVIGSAVVPLLSCGLGWVCFKFAALISASVPGAYGSEATEIVAESLGFVFALCTASTALVLMSIIVCAKTVGAV